MPWPQPSTDPREVIFARPAKPACSLLNWGRNRGYVAAGIAAQRVTSSPDDYVVLRGITTRGETSTAAELLLPVANIDEAIAMLESMK